MSDVISVACPNCRKKLQVPAGLAGKTIKCKECQTAFKVGAAASPPLAAKKVKKAALAEAPKEEEDEDGGPANPYGLIKNAEEEIARCPHCAIALDPPDTKVCLNCGYDLLVRSRHESKKVFELTFADYAKYHFLTVVCLLVFAALVGVIVVCVAYMGDIFEEIGLRSEQEDPVSKKKEFYVPPGACSTPIVVFSLFGLFKSGRFVIRRLFKDWRPPETIKK